MSEASGNLFCIVKEVLLPRILCRRAAIFRLSENQIYHLKQELWIGPAVEFTDKSAAVKLTGWFLSLQNLTNKNSIHQTFLKLRELIILIFTTLNSSKLKNFSTLRGSKLQNSRPLILQR